MPILPYLKLTTNLTMNYLILHAYFVVSHFSLIYLLIYLHDNQTFLNVAGYSIIGCHYEVSGRYPGVRKGSFTHRLRVTNKQGAQDSS